MAGRFSESGVAGSLRRVRAGVRERTLGDAVHAGERDLHRGHILGAHTAGGTSDASDHGAFVTAIRTLQANVLAKRRSWRCSEQPSFIQSESSEYFHAEDPTCLPLAHALNEKRFLALDLTYGYPLCVGHLPVRHPERPHQREEYHWFRDNHVKAHCIMGNGLLLDQRAHGAIRTGPTPSRARSSATT